MKLVGKLSFSGKEYGLNDSKGFMFPGRDYKQPSGFYGGRVDKLAKTEVKGLYMCMEGMTPIDLMLRLEDDPTKATIEAYMTEKNMEIPDKATKADLIEILK